MRKFEEFLATGDIRKTSIDKGLARALMERAEEGENFAMKAFSETEFVTLTFESLYEALIEIIDALMALDGYKPYSHVASLSFLQKFQEITQLEIAKLDNAREKRNSSKYRGEKIRLEETKDLIALYKLIKPKLKEIYKRLGG